MRSNGQNRRWAAGLAMAAGGAFAAALMGLADPPVAGADEGSLADTLVDDLYQGIGNFFTPEAEGNVFTADYFQDLLTGEGTPADQIFDAFNQLETTAFQPEGLIDELFDGEEGQGLDVAVDNDLQAIANLFAPEGPVDQFSDLFTGDGTAADQIFDGFYAAVNMAFQPEGLIDGFFDQMWTVAIL